jgi:hypothetical protein
MPCSAASIAAAPEAWWSSKVPAPLVVSEKSPDRRNTLPSVRYTLILPWPSISAV